MIVSVAILSVILTLLLLLLILLLGTWIKCVSPPVVTAGEVSKLLYTILYHTILYSTMLYYTILHYTILYYIITILLVLYYGIEVWWCCPPNILHSVWRGHVPGDAESPGPVRGLLSSL